MPAEVQLRLLPDFVCKADELALSFDHWYLCITTNTEANLTDRQRAGLDALDAKLDEMSGADKEHLWAEEALSIERAWEEVRQLAAAALDAFGWEIAVPPSYDHEYIQPQQGQ